eukprot:TRINITY_DN2827_c0_g1_i2.p1 TRINITY_DN2827_c0_g1~~TRINITY_DN2827_c0_g1_i2.p1  ORF type:complete len:555 (+),score=83.60 TRINITY_DN2827_c0_g1_i2:81-1745(+)
MAMKRAFVESCAMLLLSSYFTVAAGKGFLSVREVQEVIIDINGPADLLSELERLDRNPAHEKAVLSRKGRLQDALEPLYKLAPQDAAGKIDAVAARYLLHRLFLQRHGWHVNGIEAQSVAHNTTVGEALQRGGKFTLSDLALFAATLEVLVHNENAERLQKAFDVHKYSKQEPSSIVKVREIVEAYMVFFILAYHYPAEAMRERSNYQNVKSLVQKIPEWKDTMVFANEIQQSIFENNEDVSMLTLWDACLQVVEAIGERYGRWQNKECVSLKSKLLEMETQGNGRIPLTEFWRPLLRSTGSHLFHESFAFLEQIGALEGTAPHHSVLIPNYLYSSANCAAGSKYYTVCCINECDTLLGDIETHIGESAATPQRLADFIGTLSSSTVTEPRQLSEALVQRLEEISSHHGGLVPLHGRLFAQFMHHVFPRECPYPHVSSNGAEKRDARIMPGTPAAVTTRSEVESYLQAAKSEEEEDDAASESCPIRWTNEEELFMQSACSGSTAESPAVESDSFVGTPRVGLLLSVVAMAVALWRRRDTLLGTLGKGSSKTILV